MKNDSQGFSLIELLIVVAIILIIAAIAIPNLMRSRVAANQASAVGSLRTLSTAEFTYSATYSKGYSATLGYLGPPPSGAADLTHSGVVDSLLSGVATGGLGAMTATKSGYLFTYSPGAPINGEVFSYTITADPINRGTTGTNSFFVDQTGVIRQNSTTQAGLADSPLAG